MAIDPTTVRISEHFLLSDFMICHSMMVNGYKNPFLDPKSTKIAEIMYLCDTILEPLLVENGPFSISYGYISPELSTKIVKYQDPNKPSYHLWNAGAAVDICVHDHVLREKDGAPIYLAHEIDSNYVYSRMITYSESPFICIATRLSEEDGVCRAAFYENRYEGKAKAKPKYVTYGPNRAMQKATHGLLHDWHGAGYPTYHGGGLRQAQHVRLGRYAMLLDFLYSTACVNEGRRNIPSPDVETRRSFYRAGKAYSKILEVTGLKRMSIVRAYESPLSFEKSPYNWEDGFIFQCVPPESADHNEVAEQIIEIDCKHSVGVDNRTRTITIAGR
jgi:hypothetical protein